MTTSVRGDRSAAGGGASAAVSGFDEVAPAGGGGVAGGATVRASRFGAAAAGVPFGAAVSLAP